MYFAMAFAVFAEMLNLRGRRLQAASRVLFPRSHLGSPLFPPPLYTPAPVCRFLSRASVIIRWRGFLGFLAASVSPAVSQSHIGARN